MSLLIKMILITVFYKESGILTAIDLVSLEDHWTPKDTKIQVYIIAPWKGFQLEIILFTEYALPIWYACNSWLIAHNSPLKKIKVPTASISPFFLPFYFFFSFFWYLILKKTVLFFAVSNMCVCITSSGMRGVWGQQRLGCQQPPLVWLPFTAYVHDVTVRIL